MKRRLFAIFGGLAAMLLAAAPTAAQQLVVFAATNPGSIYNSTASVIAKLLADRAGLRATIQSFGGPTVYMPVVNAGEVDFGLSNVFELSLAVQGKMDYEGRPNPNLRAVSVLYPIRVGIFVRKDSDIRTVADLKGRRAPVGWTSQRILIPVLNAIYATAGLSEDDFEGVRVANIVAQANAFVEGEIDFFIFAVGAGKVREVDAAVGGVRLLTLENTPEALAAIRRHVPVSYLRHEKPAPPLTGLEAPGWVMAYDSVLFGHTGTSGEVVRTVLEALRDGKDELAAALPLFRLFDPDRMAVEIEAVEYHAAAQAFYEEIGQWPPRRD